LAAALIRAIPAGEILRFGRAVAGALCVTLRFAQRARWAAAMRRRAEADMVRAGAALTVVPLTEVSAWIAWSIRLRSCCSSLIIPSMFGMDESVTSREVRVIERAYTPGVLHDWHPSEFLKTPIAINSSGTEGELAPAGSARVALGAGQ
jgi:hypothetical protein